MSSPYLYYAMIFLGKSVFFSGADSLSKSASQVLVNWLSFEAFLVLLMSAVAAYQSTSVSRAHYNPDAIILLKVWGSVGGAGSPLGSLVKRLLVKFNRRLWFKPPSISRFLCFSVLFLFTLFNVFPAALSFPHPPPLHLFLSSLRKWMCLSMFFPARIFSLSASAVKAHYFLLPSDLHLSWVITLFSSAAPTLILLHISSM